MATYVLVHGTWHGGWCWKKVTPLLNANGHKVFTPTLTGLGERAHLINPEVDLYTHIQDVLGVLQYEDLQDVVLVGHSYSGMVITGVAEYAATQLSHLVYLDALVPQDGQSVMDIMPVDFIETFKKQAQTDGEGWKVPVRESTFGVTSEADLEWLCPKLVPHPLKTFEQPVQLGNLTALALPRTYIRCFSESVRTKTFIPFVERAQNEGWHYYELMTGHDAMVTAPYQLTEVLLQLAT